MEDKQIYERYSLEDTVFMRFCLIHFWIMFPFHNPWKHQKTWGFLVFSGGIKRKHWPQMSYKRERERERQRQRQRQRQTDRQTDRQRVSKKPRNFHTLAAPNFKPLRLLRSFEFVNQNFVENIIRPTFNIIFLPGKNVKSLTRQVLL